MLTKRIIPCLDIKNGRTVKGVNFLDLKDAGDPVELANKYAETGETEIVHKRVMNIFDEKTVLKCIGYFLGKALILIIYFLRIENALNSLKNPLIHFTNHQSAFKNCRF